ncbi:methyl-accepting chemotaxis protein [Pelosinus propionicus]|uniref:Methyl-accepting chemotaxis protein n=1 Tax=Pelosinus propionicus DSM 13327 TaxID=1123291 RepID=A0A1I4JVD2_9FIRM|nr:methyl-accepting chemotaxis protein [Pelosinus propionicus]SFL70545.1 methyl-accepting chemotaxis protein [Pelosinus propionicus DSM 13327]
MRWLKNLKIARQLSILIFAFILSLITVGYTGYHYLLKSNSDVEEMYTERLLPIKWVNDSRTQSRGIDADMFELLLTSTKEENKKALLQDITKRDISINKSIEKYEGTRLVQLEIDILKNLHENLNKYHEARAVVINLIMQNKNKEAYELFNQNVRPYSEAIHNNYYDLSAYNSNNASEINKQNKNNFINAIRLFIGIILFDLLAIILLAWVIVKFITKPLTNTTQFLNTMTEGDFSQTIPEKYIYLNNEFGTLAKALDKMNKGIKNLLGQIANSSQQLAASSEEMTASAEQSSQSSSQVVISITGVAQASARQLKLVDATTQIVGQVSRRVQQVAEHAVIASQAAEKTEWVANDGGHVIEKVINQMNMIEEKTTDTANAIGRLVDKSNQIGQIVETISNIARQTNLLSLNAAIEAARAGEGGKGFAVVADEVRKLAEQSQRAAKQIENLISEVQQETKSAVIFMEQGKKEVDNGTNVVTIAGQSFSAIIQMIKQISDPIHEISAAIQQITSESEQVVIAVQKIDKESRMTAEQTEIVSAATEEQSASSTEVSDASQALAKMADELQNIMQMFKA